jgi:hypothetical protein
MESPERKKQFWAVPKESLRIPERSQLNPEEVAQAFLEKENAPIELLPSQLEELARKNPEQAKNSEAFRKFKQHLQEIYSHNEKITEQYKEKDIPQLKSALKDLLLELEVDPEITEELEDYEVYFLDRYSFWYAGLRHKDASSKTTRVIGGTTSMKQIFINIDGVQRQYGNLQGYGFSAVLLHEFMHAISHTQHWFRISPEKKNALLPLGFRRTGLMVKRAGGQEERLSFLDEALTEKLSSRAYQIFLEKYSDLSEESRKKLANFELSFHYSKEQKILALIAQKIPYEMFVRAYFKKEGFLPLARKLIEIFGKEGLARLEQMIAKKQYEEAEEFVNAAIKNSS